MPKSIVRNGLVFVIIIILLTSVIGVGSAEDETLFSEEDCECGGLEMVLEESTADPYGGKKLTCSYSKGETGNIELEVIYYQNGAADGFQTRLDWVEWMLESPERVQIFDSEISDDRCFYTQRKPTTQIGFDFVERHQTVLYKENYVIKIDGSDSLDNEGEFYVSFGDYEEFVKAFEDLENCIKDMIDSKTETVEKKITGKITGFNLPIQNIVTVLFYNDQFYDNTNTDSNGTYELKMEDMKEGEEFKIRIELSYRYDNITYFEIYFKELSIPFAADHDFTYNSDEDLVQNINLNNILTEDTGDDAFISMYVHFSEAIDFYSTVPIEETNFQLPVKIRSFYKNLPQGGAAGYIPLPDGTSLIAITENASFHKSPLRPMFREYHEYSHYFMYNLYGKFPESPDTPIKEVNHGGYLNPTTADSFVEGFAHFMATVMLFQYYGESIPPTYVKSDGKGFLSLLLSSNDPFSGPLSQSTFLEYNYKAWDRIGQAEELAVAGVLFDLWDSDATHRIRTPEEAYERFLNLSFDELVPNVTLADFQANNLDDDNVEMDFLDIWAIISKFHEDFTSVYNAFIAKYPKQKQGIDEIFKNHGFFLDEDSGNNQIDRWEPFYDANNNNEYDDGEYFIDFPKNISYDTGEQIGTASNYERIKWRKSIQDLPGQYIKVDNDVPFYEIGVINILKPHLDYFYRSRNNDGLIYVPVPPENQDIVIVVGPEDVTYDESLIFTAKEFNEAYLSSVEQGYYTEHDFEITGEIPSPPTIPQQSLNSDKNPDPNGTSGFEILFLLIAGILVSYLKRRKK